MHIETDILLASDFPQEILELLERWRAEAKSILYSDQIQWFAKLASTRFTYRERTYEIHPVDVYSESDFKECPANILHAGFEILQRTITKDLIKLGAENIDNRGFMD